MIEGIERKGIEGIEGIEVIERKRNISFSGSLGSEQLQTFTGWETILLVDDEEVVRTSIRKILEKFGYRVLEAQDGEEAKLICEHSQNLIHLMLTDMIMPNINGLYLARRLKLSRPHMRVILMSGNTNLITDQYDSLSAEDFELLPKPFALAELLSKVREVLDTPGKELSV